MPRIYFEAEWPLAASPVDVLAIDRDGVGDAHVVEIRQTAADALRETERLLTTSAPFRWIAFPRGSEDEASLLAILSERGLFIAGSPGRVGIIEIAEIASGDLGANVRLAAERFPDAVYEVATRFSGSHKAHIQFGD